MNKQDLINWKIQFERVIKTCSWTQEIAIGNLLALTSFELRSIDEGKQTFSQKLAALLQCKYPYSSTERYNCLLNSIQQDKYRDIQDYVTAINLILTRWTACTNAPQDVSMTKRKSDLEWIK